MTRPSVFVTGAASGIGRALTDRLAQAGHRVFATDINSEGLAAAAREGRWPEEAVRTRALDVRDPEEVRHAMDAAFEHTGGLDVLCNVAGYLHPGYAHEADLADVDRHVDVNVKGVMYLTMCAARHMVARKRGHIVNVASMAGIAGIPGLCMYSASKFAVRGWSLAVATELRQHGVHVTVVCPDAVQTPMLDKQVDFEEAALTFSGSRALSPDDVVDAILDDVLPNKPLELLLPRSRGILAKLASAAPGMQLRLEPLLRRKGRKAQRGRAGES